MDNLRKAAEMSLDALKAWLIADVTKLPILIPQTENAVFVLSQALAQPEQTCCCGEPDALGVVHRKDNPCYVAQPEQEPVAWQVMVENEPMKEFSIKDVAHDWAVTEKLNGSKYSYWIRPLYTAPISEPVKERISEPLANQEPVDRQTLIDCVAGSIIYHFDMSLLQKKVLATAEYIVDHYTTPPSKPWVSLTDEEIAEIQYSTGTQVEYELFDEGEYGTEINIYPEKFARAIEAKLKEKNT